MADAEIVKSRLKAIIDFNEIGNGRTVVRKDVLNDALSVIEEQQAEIERLQPRWIQVSERLPKSMANKVLVWLEHDDLVGYIGYGHYEKYKGVETWYDLEHEEPFSTNGYMVTHWMPLPEPPKDGDGDEASSRD